MLRIEGSESGYQETRTMKKIKYVQLEPAEVLLDSDVQQMSDKEFGCFMRIVLYLYQHGGKIRYDSKQLAKLCNCRRNFDMVWRKIAHKFQLRGDIITHKRVTAELKRARKFAQDKRRAGLASARAGRCLSWRVPVA